MAGKISKSVSIEEAVALMVGLQAVPRGQDVLSFLNEVWNDAGIEHFVAKNADASEFQLELLQRRVAVCKSRYELASMIMRSLSQEVNDINNDASILKLADDSSITAKLTLKSLTEWAFKSFFISLPTYSLPTSTERKYKSTLLDILDHAVVKHWNPVKSDSDYSPKNDVIQHWMKTTYPKVAISAKVSESICTIIRPDEHRSKSEMQKLLKP